MVCSFSALKSKKVFNISDGKDLGVITDISFSFPEGKIEKIFVGEKKLFSFADRYEMNVCCITRIGDDAVFVDLKPDKKEE